MAVPPGTYLFYAMWKPRDPRVAESKIVVEFRRFRLEETFATRWLSVADRPITGVDLRVSPPPQGAIDIQTQPSESLQSVFLLPWGMADETPPDLDDWQAWNLAWHLGNVVSIQSNEGRFTGLPPGRYRLFLTQHDQPVDDDDLRSAHRLTHHKAVTLLAGGTATEVFH